MIEAPEYEAPLYYLQIRRALGLGPRRKPPLLVHFHSPTEVIARFDEWDPGVPAHVLAKRFEDHSIAAADGWLCPSRYLARQAEATYGLPADSVAVVPYPLGPQRLLSRAPETWAHGTICYVGRLEGRKGVIEWIKAAVSVAHDHPDARFEFVGRNILESRWLAGDQVVAGLIPERVRHQFAFLGEQPRANLIGHFARARIAVVPSRWDNFPNTCVEAMASGLPVIASREGGMVEMLRDGRTGWLAAPDPSGLADALRRALATPAATLEAMGQRAAADIRTLCDNDQIVTRQLELRRTLVAAGSGRSLTVPATLPWTRGRAARATTRASARDTARGIAVVVCCSRADRELDAFLVTLTLQSRRPEVVLLIGDKSADDVDARIVDQLRAQGSRLLHQEERDLRLVRDRAIETLRAHGARLLGAVFVEPGDRLDADFVAETERVLTECPSVGVVSFWTGSRDAGADVRVRPCPAFPYQWLWNDAAPCSVVRVDALEEVGELGPIGSRSHADWLLVTAVMAAGWAAVTVPRILGSQRTDVGNPQPAASAVRRELLQRFADAAAPDTQELVLLTSSPGAVWLGREELSARDYARMAWEARGAYGRVLRWLLSKVRIELRQRWR